MRAIWSGTISFGLVSVAVRMFTATESKELRFRFLERESLAPIGYEKVRKDTGEHVDPDDVVRGFEIEKGRFVPLEDDDLDRLDIELTHSIDICDFVSLDEIDPIYFRKAYYLAPQDGARSRTSCSSRRSTRAARSASRRSSSATSSISPACARTKALLLLETMYYADEVRKPDEIEGVDGKVEVRAAK